MYENKKARPRSGFSFGKSLTANDFPKETGKKNCCCHRNDSKWNRPPVKLLFLVVAPQLPTEKNGENKCYARHLGFELEGPLHDASLLWPDHPEIPPAGRRRNKNQSDNSDDEPKLPVVLSFILRSRVVRSAENRHLIPRDNEPLRLLDLGARTLQHFKIPLGDSVHWAFLPVG